MQRLWLALLLGCFAMPSVAQVGPGCGGGGVSPPCAVTTTPSATTWQATMTLAAATSTQLVDANVTRTPNSAATPASFGVLTVINSGSNPVIVCQFGGTCSATAGGGYIAAGACDTFNISPASVPTLFSISGTTLSLRNGPGC